MAEHRAGGLSAPRPLATSAQSTRFGPEWWPRLHLVVTAGLLLTVLALAGLAAAGRVRFGQPAAAPESSPTAEKPGAEAAAGEGARYRIEKLDDFRDLLDSAGKLSFFGPQVLEAWVFKYQGGFLQCQIEGEVDGQTAVSEPLPGDWKPLLVQDEGIAANRASAFAKQGYILLTAMPSRFSVEEALATYHLPLTGLLAGGTQGPLHVLQPLHLEVSHRRPYRLYLSTGPQEKGGGAGFNLWAEHMVTIRGPLVARNAATEEYHVGGGKDITPGKDVILLDRKRGYSRVRLKARFLGDGEIRELARKGGS